MVTQRHLLLPAASSTAPTGTQRAAPSLSAWFLLGEAGWALLSSLEERPGALGKGQTGSKTESLASKDGLGEVPVNPSWQPDPPDPYSAEGQGEKGGPRGPKGMGWGGAGRMLGGEPGLYPQH